MCHNIKPEPLTAGSSSGRKRRDCSCSSQCLPRCCFKGFLEVFDKGFRVPVSGPHQRIPQGTQGPWLPTIARIKLWVRLKSADKRNATLKSLCADCKGAAVPNATLLEITPKPRHKRKPKPQPKKRTYPDEKNLSWRCGALPYCAVVPAIRRRANRVLVAGARMGYLRSSSSKICKKSKLRRDRQF